MDGIVEAVYGVMGKTIEVVYSYEPLAAKTVVLGKHTRVSLSISLDTFFS